MDIGSYSGMSTILFSKAVGPNGLVIGVEPDPINFKACNDNLAMYARFSGLTNFSLFPVAVSAFNGTLAFSSEGAMGSSAISIVGAERGNVIEVPCVTLETLVKRAGPRQVDFIKMDIEGSELEVLRSAGDFFRDHRPRLVIEPHYLNGVLNTEDIIDCLKLYGYRVPLWNNLDILFP